jgi:hypothetical protein
MKIDYLYFSGLTFLFVVALLFSINAYDIYRKRGSGKRIFACYKMQAFASLLLAIQILVVFSFRIAAKMELTTYVTIASISLLVSALPTLVAWNRYAYYRKAQKQFRYPSYVSQRSAYLMLVAADILLLILE